MNARSLLLSAGALALLAAGSGAQDDPGSDSSQDYNPQLLNAEDVVLEMYQPRHVDPHELFDLTRATVGRSIYITERGGYRGQPVQNVSLLGDRVVITDRSDYAQLVLERMVLLDQPASAEDPQSRTRSFEYTPRFITANAALQALTPYRSPDGSNLSWLSERNLIVVRDSESNVQQIEAVLRRVDVPEPQVVLTCYLVQGSSGGDPSGLPADLVKNLGNLLPQFTFESVGFAMLQTSVSAGRSVELRIEGMGPSYSMSLSPVAWDTQSGALTVQGCTLRRHSSSGHIASMFSTNTVLRSGEYTVLGATGTEPVFLVLKLDALR